MPAFESTLKSLKKHLVPYILFHVNKPSYVRKKSTTLTIQRSYTHAVCGLFRGVDITTIHTMFAYNKHDLAYYISITQTGFTAQWRRDAESVYIAIKCHIHVRSGP